jgi:hypothetical protein
MQLAAFTFVCSEGQPKYDLNPHDLDILFESFAEFVGLVLVPMSVSFASSTSTWISSGNSISTSTSGLIAKLISPLM